MTKEKAFERKFFGGHFGQAFFPSVVYAALFVIALLIEIAYRFDAFKHLASNLSAPIFLWILLTSLSGLFLGRNLASKSAFYGFFLAAGIFFSAALLLHLLLGAFLPAHSVTEANFQTFSAHAAYLKAFFIF